MINISPVTPLPLTRPESAARPEEKESDFSGFLLDSLEQARNAEAKAMDMSQRFAEGDPAVGIHEVMIATERASVTMRYAVTLKNKAIEAYRELMNTPL